MKTLSQSFFVFLSFFISSLSFAANTIIIPDNEFNLSLSNYVDIYEDQNKNLELNDFLSDSYKNRFRPNHQKNLKFGYSQSAYWLRFTMHNVTSVQQQLILSINSPAMDYIDLYKPIGNSFQEINTGASRPYSSRTLDNTSFIFTVKIPAQASHTYYLRLESRAPLNLNFDLYSPLSFAQSENQSQWYWGIALGILIAALIYNFFSAFLHNDRAPLYLALLGFSIAFYQLNWSGNIASYLGSDSEMQSKLFNFSLFFGNLSLILFIKHALTTKLNTELSSKFITIITSICIVGGLVSLTIATPSIQLASLLCSIVIGFAIIFFLLKRYDRKYPFMRIFIVAHSLVVVIQVIGLLTASNFLDYSFITEWGGVLFTTLEFFVLTFALMARRNQLLEKHKKSDQNTPKPTRSNAEFLNKLSHDLRTPMNGVLGMAELMEETPLGRQQQDYLATIQSSGRELLHLINDVSLYSKLEDGKIELENRSFDLNLFISNIADGFQQNATNRRLEFIIDSNLDERALVIGDPQRLEHILYNLLSNAFHYTEQGDVILHVMQQPNNKNRFLFRVSDTGAGISKKDQERLFTSFDLLEPSRKHSFQGTGFGLALCKQLVDLMGGEIKVESELGAGTSFSFDILLFKQDREEIINSTYDLEGLSMLIVDDNLTFRRVIERYAKSWDIKIDSTSSGKEALALLRTKANLKEPYDIIIIDQDMPIMNGLQLANKIKDDPSINENLLKVMLTGLNISSINTAAQEAGIDTVLTKPMTKKMLKENLSILIQQRKNNLSSPE
jgi:signal transduction histidine kinase/CheY-like chemotaxis protein